MEAPSIAPPPPPPVGAAPVVKLPPADPTKEIAGTRSEHRVNIQSLFTHIIS